MNRRTIQVEVVYATFTTQKIISVTLHEGSSVRSAILKSGILTFFPEIDLEKQGVGIFNQRCDLEDELIDGDRVEIYRPLIMDPKEARRKKAKKR